MSLVLYILFPNINVVSPPLYSVFGNSPLLHFVSKCSVCFLLSCNFQILKVIPISSSQSSDSSPPIVYLQVYCISSFSYSTFEYLMQLIFFVFHLLIVHMLLLIHTFLFTINSCMSTECPFFFCKTVLYSCYFLFFFIKILKVTKIL